MDQLRADGWVLNTMRIRGFPFQDEVLEFIHSHDQVFLIEQNRDNQMQTLLVNEFEVSPRILMPISHVDGTPIDAASITRAIASRISRNDNSQPSNGGAK